MNVREHGVWGIVWLLLLLLLLQRAAAAAGYSINIDHGIEMFSVNGASHICICIARKKSGINRMAQWLTRRYSTSSLRIIKVIARLRGNTCGLIKHR